MRYLIILAALAVLTACGSNGTGEKHDTKAPTRGSSTLTNTTDSANHEQLNNEPEFEFSDSTSEEFRKRGIHDPEHYVIQSLRNNSELIPLEPVLGGNMRFTNIQLLNNKQLIAYYEDGHITGHSIFQFEFKNDSLTFSIITSATK